MLNGLWRNADFVRLWTSLTITHFGGQITFLALPLTAALLLDATPFEMGVLIALESVPFALFGLFAGVLVDRAPKLPIIVWSDIGCAALDFSGMVFFAATRAALARAGAAAARGKRYRRARRLTGGCHGCPQARLVIVIN